MSEGFSAANIRKKGEMTQLPFACIEANDFGID